MRNSSSASHRALLLGGIFATVLLLAFGATAFAQEQQEKPPEFKEEVTVTGTLIPRPTLEAMSPVTTMNVEDLAYQGTTRLEDMLTSLPQIFHGQNSTISNGATGTATIDLRYLGSVRTLVLIDGKRAPAGDTGSVSPDLNFIPAALVKRVDVLTGGASSTYGADAVAGVVNFILDRDFEGAKVGLMGGGYEHNNDNTYMQEQNKSLGFKVPSGQAWDGGQFEAYAALGGKFAEGKGHATIYVDYRKTAADLKARRDYLNCSVLSSLTDTGPACGGSGTIPNGRFQVYTPDYAHRLGNYTIDTTTGDTFRNRTGADVFNYAPYNYMQRPDERWAGGAFVNYEWNKHFQGYLDVMMMDDYSDAQIAPSGSFGSVLQQINCDNPMLSADEQAKICPSAYYGPHDMASVVINKRGVEGGGRDDQLRHESYRLVAGLKGEIDKVWSYDVYGLNAQTSVPEVYTRDYSYAHIQDALIVDGDPNDPSTWHCRSGNANCAPWDIFKLGAVTQAALNYVQIPLVSVSHLTTQVLSGKLTADLKDYGIAFPSATEGVGFAVGTEYRKEFLSFQPDQSYIDATGAGQGGARVPVSGFYDVKEAFVEATIPFIQGKPLAKDLSVDLGYRYSDYNINGSWPTYKVQASWAPSDSFKFRVGFNRATRAPNIGELFSPQNVAISGDITDDPCAGPTPIYSQAQCAHTGMTADQYNNHLVDKNPAQQYNGQTGGNPLLKPEIADTRTFGIVFTPSGLSGFTAALDYYDIKIKDVVSTLPGNNIITRCAETGDPALCSLIHRDQFGTLWMLTSGYVAEINGNYGQRDVEGIDVNMTYTMPAGSSIFSFNLIGSYMNKWELKNAFFNYDCASYFGNTCGDPSPKWRHLFRATWDTGLVSISAAWRFVGAVTTDEANPSPALYTPADFDLLKANMAYHYSAYNYVDLAATFKLSKAAQFMVGVNNIADKEPPLGAGYSPNDYGPGFHGTYDPYGRYIHGSLNFQF